MKINYNDKIETINNDRNTLINLIKENNNTQINKLNASLEGLNTVFDLDNQNIKEYNLIKKAKMLIKDLTEKILQCTNIEDIKKLRSQINYYINKIKKELKNRNIDQDTMDKMFDGVSSFRKSIATYIRVLKREVTISEIYDLYQNLDTLSSDDKDRLKKLVSNELKYNKRNLNNFLNVDEPKQPESKDNLEAEENRGLEYAKAEENNGEENSIDDLTSEAACELLSDIDETIEKQDVDILSDIDPKESIQALKSVLMNYGYIAEKVSDSQDSLKSKMDVFKGRYYIEDLKTYNGKFISDFISFIHNIPIQFYNKKRTQLMLKHYNKSLYSGEDFKYYIMYCLKNSSIKTAFEMLFKNSQLARREAECLYNHDRCVEWINDYYLTENLRQEATVKRTLSKPM